MRCVSSLTLKLCLLWRNLIKSSCKAWWRTSREYLRQIQSWFQGKVHRSLQIQRWSPARSFLVTAQILNKKNILREIFLLLRCFLTEHGWLSKKDVHNGNVLLVGIIVQITLLRSYREKLKRLELPFGFLFLLTNWNLNKKFSRKLWFQNWHKLSQTVNFQNVKDQMQNDNKKHIKRSKHMTGTGTGTF